MGERSRAIRDRRAERDRNTRHKAYLRRTAQARGCLFCRRNDGGFTSREHVFPESLGNSGIVLPPGVVCDRCNNESLSKLDKDICEFGPIVMRRTLLGVPSKRGIIPTFRYSEGSVEHVPSEAGGEPTLVFKSQGSSHPVREVSRTDDGRVKLEWTVSGGRRMTSRYASDLSRALLKSALECAWLDHRELTLSPQLDHVRATVLGAPRSGFFVMVGRANPDDTRVSLTYNLLRHSDRDWRMPVVASYFGVTVYTDSSLPAPPFDPDENGMCVLSFTPADMRSARAPDEANLVTEDSDR